MKPIHTLQDRSNASPRNRAHAAPIAYEVDGTEYIAIQSGWGVDAQCIQDALAGDSIGIESNVPQGGVVWVFAVKK